MRYKKRDHRICGNGKICGKVNIVLLSSLSLLIGLSLFFTINSLSSYTLAEPGEGQTSTTDSYKSPLIWRMDEEGDYLLSELAAGKTYELVDAIETPGQIKTFTASWQFKGQVTLELSANNGQDYAQVVYGVPLASGFISGDQLKWRVTLSPDSELSQIKIAYTDTSGVTGTFGIPALSGFKFRKPIYITNPSGEALFNYQIRVEVKEEEIRTEADFADIRFTAADKETPLPHYLESITGNEPARIAVYYVNVPQFPEDGLKIYLYYGNSDAIELSDADKVFDFFDDFTQDELDAEKWEAYTDLEGSYGLSDSQLKLGRTKIISQTYRFKDGIIEYQARAETGLENRLIIRGSEESPEQIAYSSAYQGAEHCLAVGGIVKKNENKPISTGTVYRYKVEAYGDNLTFKRYPESPAYEAGNFEAEVRYTDEGGLKQGYIGLETGEGSSAYYDWLRVRKYAEPEPSVSALGDEEKVNLAEFTNTMVANNGDLVLASAEGVYSLSGTYTTAPVFTACDISVIIPMIKTDNKKALIDISADGGISWKEGCASSKVYTAPDDFKTGKHLLLRANLFIGNTGASPEIEELKLEYSIAPIVTSANVHCSGATGRQGVYISGDTMIIQWDNSSNGDNNPNIISVSCNFEFFGGDAQAKMHDENSDNIYIARWPLPAEISTSANIFVTATNACGLTTRNGHILTVNTYPKKEQKKKALESQIISESEEIDLEEELEEEGQRSGTQLYDVVVKLGDNHNPDPEEDARGCYKHGEVVIVRPSGHLWSETERSSFLIVQAYLTAEEAQSLTMPEEIPTDELDKDGRPVIKRTGRRAKRFQLEKLGLSKTDKRKEKLSEVSDRLKFSSLKRGVIEEKE